MQFQSFLEDPQYKDQHELQTTMIRTFGKVAPHAEPHFRDEGIAIRHCAKKLQGPSHTYWDDFENECFYYLSWNSLQT